MKNVLSLALLTVLLFASSCSFRSTQAAVDPSPTATLRAVPTPSRTPQAAINRSQSSTLLPSDPTATPFVHVITEGDSLLSIAIQYGVSLEALLLVNPGIDPQFLTVGSALRIPGPEGEAVDVLLPTPTPVPLKISSVRCFESLTGVFQCLATIENTSSTSVDSISGIIGLYDRVGGLLEQESCDSYLQFLPSGKALPLSVFFNEKPDHFAFASVEILSAIQTAEDDPSMVLIQGQDVEWETVDDGAGASIAVTIQSPEPLDDPPSTLRLMGMAHDESGEIVGFRVVEQILESSESLEVEFSIGSLGPEIADVTVLAETINLD